MSWLRRSINGVNILGSIRSDTRGLMLVKDWLGEGGETVPQVQADDRAALCLKCPKNVLPNWWGKVVKHPVIEIIHEQLELKNARKLAVPQEDKLHLCDVCGCAINLAVWAPVERLAEHTPTDHLHYYPDFCWKRKEIEALNKT